MPGHPDEQPAVVTPVRGPPLLRVGHELDQVLLQRRVIQLLELLGVAELRAHGVATGGIKVYLRSGDYPALTAGDQVGVTGWTRQFHGEVELSVPGPSYLARLGPGEPPRPVYVRTGQVGEAREGKLILIAGRVVKFEPQALTLDDGTGPTRIFFSAELPWHRPYVNVGEFGLQGVVGQYAAAAPWEGGYRVIPLLKTDMSDAPLVLPVTGGE